MGHSRYDGLPVATHAVLDGAGGTRGRRVPAAAGAPGAVDGAPLAVHQVLADDRVDLLADRYLGDPQAWWRICDANAALDPDELVGPDNAGALIVIGVPEA